MDEDDTMKSTVELLEEYSRIVVLSFCPDYQKRAREIIDELKRRRLLSETKRPLGLASRRIRNGHARNRQENPTLPVTFTNVRGVPATTAPAAPSELGSRRRGRANFDG
jgi:hypothetical protein